MKLSLSCRSVCLSAAVLLVASPLFACAQDAPAKGAAHATPAMQGETNDQKAMPSPPASADVRLDGKALLINYHSPAMRGRKIMGGLVPWGKVWRTGANPATSFSTEADLMIGKLRVPAGKYTLFTLPAAPGTPWMLIVNKQTGQWGLEYHQDQDLGRTAMHHKRLPVPQESMSITFENTTMHQTELHVKWELTDEWVEVKTAH